MCARYNLRTSPRQLAEVFQLVRQLEFSPRYNVAPTQQVVVIRRHEASMMRWGLVPVWMKDAKGPPLINARAETVDTKPAFRSAFKKRRCLVPATGFYEWRTEGQAKRPFHIQTAGLMAFAGLWEGESAAIITTEANSQMAGLHDRMPVILRREHWDVWQDAEADPRELLRPWDGALTIEPISPAINNSRNEGPELLAPA